MAPTVDPIETRLAARDAANDDAWRTVPDAAAFKAKRTAFKDEFRRRIGVQDIVRTPLNAKTVGRKDYGAFRIEKVLMESAPGAYVAALVFLPDAAKFAPPYAGFMFIPGHSDTGKAHPAYLQTCELGARNGLAVVTYDPFGQGERSQGAGLRSADEHVRIGAYAALLGETTATYMLRDAARVFDYFEGRPDVDRTRLGVCGNSGGGTMSAFFMAADDRVRAAAPSCYLSSAREHLLANGPQDSEQNFFDELAWGFNHAALVFAAECPVLINAAVEDFFQIEGSRSTYRIVREVAAKADLPSDWYELSEAPGGHAMSKVHREAAVRFFLKHLTGTSRTVVEGETTAFTRADVTVTPEGEVSRLPGFKSIYETLAEKLEQRGVTIEGCAARARDAVLRERSGADCRAVLATLKGETVRGRPAVLHLGGTPASGEITATLFADGDRLTQRTKRKGKRSYYERRKDDEVVAVDLYLEGRSLVTLRAAELLTLAAELESRTGLKPALIAEGRFAAVAAFACAADPDAFASVRRVNEPKSYLESLRTRDYLSMSELHVPAGGVRGTDLTIPSKLAPHVRVEGDRLIVDVPKDLPGRERTCWYATLPLDLSDCAQLAYGAEVSVRGEGVEVPRNIRLALHWRDATSGPWHFDRAEVPRESSFGWTTIRLDAQFGERPPRKDAGLNLGLQQCGGRLEFDLSTLKFGKAPSIFPVVDDDRKIAYPDRVLKRGRMRGTMARGGLRTTEKDVEDLHRYGANLIRLQYNSFRLGSAKTDDPAELVRLWDVWFAAWLKHTDDVLAWAEARDMLVVIDMHNPPVGSYGPGCGLFNEPLFAARFVSAWEEIARRYRGRKGIYGYDLINEPVQRKRACENCDYWNIQRRGAEAIRRIDPDVTIIVEANNWDSPAAFSCLRALDLDNVIYQVHVYNPHSFTHQCANSADKPVPRDRREVWPNPSKGWNKDWLRADLQPVIDFQKRHNAKIYVGEFSASIFAPGAGRYLADCIELFEELGWDWTYHSFREARAWNIETAYDEQTGKIVPSFDNDRFKAVVGGWSRKTSGEKSE